nr:hypothetical protein [Gammaproteobacteria bacterium]
VACFLSMPESKGCGAKPAAFCILSTLQRPRATIREQGHNLSERIVLARANLLCDHDGEQRQSQRPDPDGENENPTPDNAPIGPDDRVGSNSPPPADAQPPQAEQGEEEDPGNSQDDDAEVEPLPKDTESAQSTRQWLRRVPDDPGGLIRRKLLYEKHRRERDGLFARREGAKSW